MKIRAAEALGGELLDEAMRLESLPYRGSRVKKRRGLLKLIHANYRIYYRIQGWPERSTRFGLVHRQGLNDCVKALLLISMRRMRH